MDPSSETFLGTQGIKPGAAGCKARMLSIVPYGPPYKWIPQRFQVNDNSLVFQCMIPAKNWRVETRVIFTDAGLDSNSFNVSGESGERSVAMSASRQFFDWFWWALMYDFDNGSVGGTIGRVMAYCLGKLGSSLGADLDFFSSVLLSIYSHRVWGFF